jgi:hypothetical protein
MNRIAQCKSKTLDQHDQQGILHLKRQRHDYRSSDMQSLTGIRRNFRPTKKDFSSDFTFWTRNLLPVHCLHTAVCGAVVSPEFLELYTRKSGVA